MKGDEEFRTKTKAAIQCSNEIYIYKKVVPYFHSFLTKCGVSPLSEAYQWVPRIYFADYKVFEGLSNNNETVLALENLTPLKYRMGPRLDLDESHLKLMIKNIASYHSVSYAMKIKKDPMFKELAAGLTPLSFLAQDGSELESYSVLFSIALQRFFTYVEGNKDLQKNENFIASVKKFKDKSYSHPAAMMEKLLRIDDTFSVLLHGDYNRNNVLFKYETTEGHANPQAIKMIDFQETRFATPVIDMAFFMYMNIPDDIREKVWDDLLIIYHETVINCLTDILKCDKDHPELKPYSFENFIEHFRKHAVYGLVVSIHFIPWLLCPDDECQKIANLFETDLKSEEFRQILQVCGGEIVDKRLVENALHAFKKGYLKIFD
jgi:hypothetical protein